MVVGVCFCKIKVVSNFLLVLKIKCTKFQTVDLHTKIQTNRHSVLYTGCRIGLRDIGFYMHTKSFNY
jgi:hypothetical protein